MQLKEFVTSIIKSDKALVLDQQIGMAFIDVNRMQQSYKRRNMASILSSDSEDNYSDTVES